MLIALQGAVSEWLHASDARGSGEMDIQTNSDVQSAAEGGSSSTGPGEFETDFLKGLREAERGEGMSLEEFRARHRPGVTSA